MSIGSKLVHAAKVVASHARLAVTHRSPQWRALEVKVVAETGACAACDGTAHLQVHHCRPFHLHPELELDEANLIVLCEAPGIDCHLRIGHGGSFAAYNPNVRADAAACLKATPTDRVRVREQAAARAKSNRLYS